MRRRAAMATTPDPLVEVTDPGERQHWTAPNGYTFRRPSGSVEQDAAFQDYYRWEKIVSSIQMDLDNAKDTLESKAQRVRELGGTL